ncbi:MAG TPA: hypothetical protein VGZ03_11200 [Acidimicrobiales bacterium]|nr:hypothetical protein [Acidimicrobiales bacterium]
MTSSNTGGWVRKVGASGGGRTYRRRRPINYYGILAVICVLGFASVAYARYDYLHPASAAPQTPPTTSDTWYAALGIATCGHQQPALAPNPTALASGFTAIAGGVIQVHPIATTQTGANATLERFVSAYRGLVVRKTGLVLPPLAAHKKATHLITGTKCPAGTKDAGKVGHVEIAYWQNLSSATAKTTTNPADVKFTNNMLITIGFVPDGVVPAKPPSSAIAAMLQAHVSASTTTTLPGTTTTLPGTTTTLPGTTTTLPGTTTTTKP